MFHILVVEDDKHTCMLFKAILESDGYTVFVAANGQGALGVLEHEHIEFFVLNQKFRFSLFL